MTIEGLQFVMLGTRDVERSIEFYRDTLQLELLHSFEGFAFFRCGAVTIVLSSDLGERMGSEPNFASELVLGVASVRSAFDELTSRGVSFVNAPRQVNADAWAANFTDPNGHHLSVYGKP